VSISDEELISQIYEVQHSHILQVEASDLASMAPLLVEMGYEEPSEQAVRILFTTHPQYHRLEFTGQLYTTVAECFIMYFFYPT